MALNFKNKKIVLVLAIFLIILSIGIFFRFWQLNSIPPGLYPDEAINANQAASSPLKIFYPENNGREGLFIWLIHFFFFIFGTSVWTLRFTSAFIGITTVFGLYFLTKEIFRLFFDEDKTEIISLASTFLLAVSFWHTNFSRIGFRAILVPFFLVFTFYFLFRTFRTKKYSDAILAGVFFGLGFYSYIAFRVAPIIVFWLLIIFWLISKDKNWQKKFFTLTAWFLIVTFTVALPLGIYFLQNPHNFVSRATGISVFSQKNMVEAFSESLGKHLAMFIFSGDNNWRHNISGKPALLWPIAILFLTGLGFASFKVIQTLLKKRMVEFAAYSLLIVWWLTMLLPGALTYEGIPHSLRVIGCIPPTYIFAGLGALIFWDLTKKALKIKKQTYGYYLLIFLIIFTFIYLTEIQYQRYFVKWGKNDNIKGAFTRNLVDIGYYLNSLPENDKKYVIVNQPGVLVNKIPMPAQTVMFIERTKHKKLNTTYLLPEKINEISYQHNTVIVPLTPDKNLFNALKHKFPNGKVEKYKNFWSFVINK